MSRIEALYLRELAQLNALPDLSEELAKNYICECGHRFDNPKIRYEDAGDEQYDECPKCGSDNYTTNN